MKKKFLLLIFLFIISYSCNDNQNTKSEINQLKIDFKPQCTISSEIFSDIKYIPLETTENNIIGKIEKIIIKNDKFYILDATYSKGLFIFDFKGNFLNMIRKLGNGPGEYTELHDFVIFNNLIVLLAYKEALYFDLNGNFQFSKPMNKNANNLIFQNDKKAFLFLNYYLSRDKFVPNHIARTDADFNIKEEYLKPNRKEVHKFNRFQNYNNTILLTSPLFLSNTIYKLNDNSLTPYIVFDFGSYNIPENIKNDIVSDDKYQLNSVIINSVINTQEFLYICAIFNRTIYMGLHLKSQDKTFFGYKIQNVPAQTPYIYAIKEKDIYGAINAFDFINMQCLQDSIQDRDSNLEDLYTSYNDLLKTIHITDNPIIVCYSIK